MEREVIEGEGIEGQEERQRVRRRQRKEDKYRSNTGKGQVG